MFFSAEKMGFYATEIHGAEIPSDAIEITDQLHADLLAGQAQGMVIVADESGFPVLAEQPPLSPAEEIKRYAAVVQRVLDAAAVSAGYDDIKTAVTYADEPAVAKFQSDGRAFRAWRSLCWDYCYKTLEEVESGIRPQPSIETFIADLPALALP